MNPIITEHQAQLAEVCQRHQILRLEVYDLPYRFGPKQAPYEVGFVAEFAKVASPKHYRRVVNLQEDLGKLLNRRVWISNLSSLKIHARNNNPDALRTLREMEPVYGNGAISAAA